MNNLRVTVKKAELLAEVLRKNGFSATVTVCTKRTLGNGCTDEGCCPQHHSFENNDNWRSILTNASGTKAHKIWVADGLVTSPSRTFTHSKIVELDNGEVSEFGLVIQTEGTKMDFLEDNFHDLQGLDDEDNKFEIDGEVVDKETFIKELGL